MVDYTTVEQYLNRNCLCVERIHGDYRENHRKELKDERRSTWKLSQTKRLLKAYNYLLKNKADFRMKVLHYLR